MKILSKPAFLFVALSILISVSVVRAQNDPEAAIAEKQAQLERQRIELEKKSLELQQKELDLEKARQEFEAQQSGRSLGDVLFDYDKAALKPEAEQALKKVAVFAAKTPPFLTSSEVAGRALVHSFAISANWARAARRSSTIL
jgi:outer membrane protein OmpA-like peptidoglycan-associated protein